ncbi:MAG: GNAT family N-acetyltransferase [Cyclobacteriaceae bacterium]
MGKQLENTRVALVEDQARLQEAFAIRNEVFVLEQGVPEADELDEYESQSRHFIAYDTHNLPCGTARWRITEAGVKLERFAVLKSHRGLGIGSALMVAILEDIEAREANKRLYLHAQVNAVGLYSKFGFKALGDQFDECGIMHYKMIK